MHRNRILDLRGLADLDDGRIDIPEISKRRAEIGEVNLSIQNQNDSQEIKGPLEEWPAEKLVEYAGRGPEEREIVESIFSRRWMERG